jgi:hypothetical protein
MDTSRMSLRLVQHLKKRNRSDCLRITLLNYLNGTCFTVRI